MPAAPSHFVTTRWLAEHLSAPDLFVIDASWHLPNAGRDAHAEYLAEHIPGAVHFDIDAISDKASALPHMLPDPVAFSSAMRNLGLGDGMRVVVYDSYGLFSAPRVWWMLRTFGVADVYVLEGGLPAWKAEGLPVEPVSDLEMAVRAADIVSCATLSTTPTLPTMFRASTTARLRASTM